MDNAIVDWIIDLQGRPYDLENWVKLFERAINLRVEREQPTDTMLPRYYLHSSGFVGLADTHIYAVAAEMIAWMNGAVGLCDGGEPVTMGLPVGIRADGSRVPMKQVISDSGGTLEILAQVGSSSTDAPKTDTFAQIYVNLATQHQSVVEALKYFGKSDDWYDFYKLYEIIRGDVGNDPKLDQKRWISKNQRENLRRTANYHRHVPGVRPKRLLSLSEARNLLRIMMRQWLTELRNS